MNSYISFTVNNVQIFSEKFKNTVGGCIMSLDEYPTRSIDISYYRENYTVSVNIELLFLSRV